MNAELALKINNFIDTYHSQELWSLPFLVGFLVMHFAFTKPPETLTFWYRFKAFLSFLWSLVPLFVGFSQAVAGGCLVHVPQNILAQVYLGKEEGWHPWGIAFREFVPVQFQWSLRLFYIIGFVYITWVCFILWRVHIIPIIRNSRYFKKETRTV